MPILADLSSIHGTERARPPFEIEERILEMVRYWVMAPAEYAPTGTKGATFRKYWQYDLEHGVISIGWDLGKAPESRVHQVRLWGERAEPEWRTGSDPGMNHGLKMLVTFWFGIEPGDIVIARAGVTKYVGVGEFQGEPYYDQDAVGLTWGCSFRRVLWAPTPGVRNSPVRFSRHALSSLTNEKVALFGL